MLKKNYVVLFLVISALLLAGCSSKKKKRRATPTGSVVFFQNIEGTGALQLKALETKERNSYGSVAFEQFTTAVSLNVGEWQVAVNQNKTGDSQNTEQLGKGKFSVKKDEVSLVAITGTAKEAKVLPLEFAKRNETRAINISHLYDGLGEVAIYLQGYKEGLDCEDESSFTEAQIASLNAGQTSESVELAVEDDEKAICVQIKAGNNVVYQSGKVALEDRSSQTLLLTKNTSPLAEQDAINLIYYSQGSVTLWSDISDQIAEVRLLNLFENDDVTSAKLELFPEPEDGEVTYKFDGSITSLALSLLDDETVPANLSYFLKADNSLPAPLIMPFSGQQITVAYFNEDEPKTMKINGLKGIVEGRSQVQLSAPLVAASTDASRYSIFLMKQTETDFNQAATTLSPRSSTVLDVEPGDYQLVVTDAGEESIVSLADASLQLKKDENYQLILYKEGGGFSLCLIDEDEAKCKAQ